MALLLALGLFFVDCYEPRALSNFRSKIATTHLKQVNED